MKCLKKLGGGGSYYNHTKFPSYKDSSESRPFQFHIGYHFRHSHIMHQSVLANLTLYSGLEVSIAFDHSRSQTMGPKKRMQERGYLSGREIKWINFLFCSIGSKTKSPVNIHSIFRRCPTGCC